ncbi:hypothetical protein BT69DRAFT_1362443 [Atractiella rhizophila]|nr:hypothetical protein BT69DRAFT_1362443 [Atractiella rhizophila]
MRARQLYAECSAASDITDCDKLLEAIAQTEKGSTEKGSDAREGPLRVTEQASKLRGMIRWFRFTFWDIELHPVLMRPLANFLGMQAMSSAKEGAETREEAFGGRGEGDWELEGDGWEARRGEASERGRSGLRRQTSGSMKRSKSMGMIGPPVGNRDEWQCWEAGARR